MLEKSPVAVSSHCQSPQVGESPQLWKGILSPQATGWFGTEQHLFTHPYSTRYYTLRMAESKLTHERGSVAGAFDCPCSVASLMID